MSLWQNIKGAVAASAEKTNSRTPVSVEEKAQIEQYVADGWNTAQIADVLDRPVKTIHPYVAQLKARVASAPVSDPLKDARIQLELIKLDTEKIKLEMLKNEMQHNQKVQEMELEMKKLEMEAERDATNDGEEDDGFNPEQLLMQILQMGKTPAVNGGAVVEVPTVPKDVPKSASIEQAKEAIKRNTSPPAGDSKPTLSPAQKKQLAAYIKKQAYSEDETVELAAAKGVSEEDARAFFREYCGG